MNKIEFINPWGQGNNSFDSWFKNEFEVDSKDTIVLTSQSRKSPKVKDGKWMDASGNEVRVIPFEEENVTIRLEFNEDAIAESYDLVLRESNYLRDETLIEDTFTVTSTVMQHTYSVRDIFVAASIDEILECYFTVDLDGLGNKTAFPNQREKYLKIHLIRFIPSIMRSLGWEYAARFQEKWFRAPAQDNHKRNSIDNSLTMDWVLSFERAQTKYNEILEKEIWKTPNAIDALLDQITQMLQDGKNNGGILLPNADAKEVIFGSFRDDLIIHQDTGEDEPRQTPHYHRYQYQYYVFEQGVFTDELDYLYGTLGDFNFNISPLGILKYEGENSYKVKLEKIMIYIGDDYSFNKDSSPEDFLGFWNVKDNELGKFPTNTRELIRDINYKNWRADHNRGGDFYIFSSDYKVEQVSYEIDVPSEKVQEWKSI